MSALGSHRGLGWLKVCILQSALCVLLVSQFSTACWAQPAADEQQLHEAFAKSLTGAKLIGFFTITGREQELKEETYRIESVKKLDGDLWLMQCQIKYGDKNVTLPVPIPVKWAGKTPVMTLDQVTLPGLGTFDARVLIHGDKYVGTWGHGEITGHMFGRIERAE